MRSLALIATLSLALSVQAAGKLVENVVTAADREQTYTLFLPGSYDVAKKYPVLLILDPRGRGTVAAEIFAGGAEEYGWILVSSNNTRSDESNDPNERALRALFPELGRYAVDPRRVYAAGFSGTAMVAWALAINNGRLAGVISAGGRLVDEVPPRRFSFASYGFAGESDFNNRDMRAIDALLAREGKTHRFRQFEGGHRWMPPELAAEAMGWMELIAMKEQRRPRDEALIARLYERELAAAKSLRQFRAVLETFDGLRDVTEVRATVARLERDPAVLRELKDEERWDAFEAQTMKETLDRTPAILGALRQEAPLNLVGRLMREFRVADLRRRAAREGYEGSAARRLLEAVHAQMSFYLMRQFFERREYRLAAAVLTVATEIHPDRDTTWYNLAAAHARAGARRPALEALAKAIELGYRDAEHLVRDEDFASLREDARFRELVKTCSVHRVP